MKVTVPALPSQQDELEALIEEARQRARRRRRRNGIVCAAAALIAVGSGLLALRLTVDRSSKAGHPRTPLAALYARVPGPFWYMRTISSMQIWMPTVRTVLPRGRHLQRRGPEVLFKIRESEETWVGTDGTVRDRVLLEPHFATAAGGTTWKAYGKPFDFNAPGWLAHDMLVMRGGRFPAQLLYQWGEALSPSGLDPGDSLFSFRQLLALPNQPTALLAQLRQAEKGLERRWNRRAQTVGRESRTFPISELTDIGSLLTSPLPTSVRLALLRAAVKLPDARVNPHAHDSMGRSGTAVSVTAGIALQRVIVDSATGVLRQGPAGTVAVQGPVGSVYALPPGVTPISAPGAPAEPPTLAISPSVGSPKTVFKLKVSAPSWGRLRKPPSLDWVIGGTPADRCFAPRLAQPLVARVAIGSPAGRLTYTYVLAPSQIPRRTWCPGRYELNVVPDYSGRTPVSHSRAAGEPTVKPATGSSAFFQVR